MPITFIAGTAKDAASTDAINTTGADLAVAGLAMFLGTFTSFVDSASNTWNNRRTDDYFGTATLRHYDSIGIITSASHTTTITASSGRTAWATFAGAHASPVDQQNGTVQTSVTTIQPGSITPSENDCCCVTTLYYESGGTVSIDSGFQLVTPGNQFIAIAYKIQTTATAENPTWTTTTNQARCIAIIVSYKAAVGGGGGGGYTDSYIKKAKIALRPRAFAPGVARRIWTPRPVGSPLIWTPEMA